MTKTIEVRLKSVCIDENIKTGKVYYDEMIHAAACHMELVDIFQISAHALGRFLACKHNIGIDAEDLAVSFDNEEREARLVRHNRDDPKESETLIEFEPDSFDYQLIRDMFYLYNKSKPAETTPPAAEPEA